MSVVQLRPPTDDARDDAGPVTVLGHDAGTYYFLSADGQYRELKAGRFVRPEILSLFAGQADYLMANFPVHDKEGKNVVGWSLNGVAAHLIAQAHQAGIFSPGRSLRGPGVWRAGGGLVVHAGDALWIDGKWQPAGRRLGREIFAATPPVDRPAAAPLTVAEGGQLLDVLGLWHWRQARHAPRLLLGWLGCAALAGALSWRPHLQLTAPPGAGKSTLFALLQGLLGSSCLTVSASTEAAIRQMLGPRAPAVLVDEIENDNPLRARPIYELARLASTEGQADVARGSAEGKASSFPVRACFIFSSVLPPRLRPQDLARIMVLEFDGSPGGADESGEPVQLRVRREVERVRSLGPPLRRRMIDDFPRLLRCVEVFEAAIAEGGARARVADQVGVLLAAAYVLTADGVPELADAAALVAEFALPDLVGHEDEGGVSACLNHLLTSEVTVEHHNGGSQRRALGELLARAAPAPRNWAQQALKRCGLALVRDGYGVDWLAVANRHRGLDQVFRDTPWSGGVWATELRRGGGARVSDKLGFGGVQSRATLLPLAGLGLDQEAAGYDSIDGGDFE